MNINTMFVYHKDKEIKVLFFDEAQKRHRDFIKSGWRHTATIEPALWIEYLFNKCDPADMIEQVYQLAQTK